MASPGDAGFWIRGVWGDAYDEAMAAYARLGTAPRRRPRAERASREAVRLAKLVADRLTPYAERDGVDPLASIDPLPRGERLRRAGCATSRR